MINHKNPVLMKAKMVSKKSKPLQTNKTGILTSMVGIIKGLIRK